MSIVILTGIVPSQDEGTEPTDDDLDAIEYADEIGEDAMTEEIMYAFMQGKSHTRCPEGCEVEIDGQCPHGYKSLVIEWRIY